LDEAKKVKQFTFYSRFLPVENGQKTQRKATYES
jgi:hypothetical protein